MTAAFANYLQAQSLHLRGSRVKQCEAIVSLVAMGQTAIRMLMSTPRTGINRMCLMRTIGGVRPVAVGRETKTAESRGGHRGRVTPLFRGCVSHDSR